MILHAKCKNKFQRSSRTMMDRCHFTLSISWIRSQGLKQRRRQLVASGEPGPAPKLIDRSNEPQSCTDTHRNSKILGLLSFAWLRYPGLTNGAVRQLGQSPPTSLTFSRQGVPFVEERRRPEAAVLSRSIQGGWVPARASSGGPVNERPRTVTEEAASKMRHRCRSYS
jgi:hypothetical protein